MIKYILVILDRGAVPFCYYENPYYLASQSELMPLTTLEAIIQSAKENARFINFIYGQAPLPAEYEDLIETVSHVKIIPLSRRCAYEDGVLVFEANVDSPENLDDNLSRNLILRVAKHDLRGLGNLVKVLMGKFKRLNLHLVGSERFTAADWTVYEAELVVISQLLKKKYTEGVEVEINVLSDRILLEAMNNCDAGTKHITVAPNGKCYICPGFYYDDEDNALGNFADNPELMSTSSRLCALSSAPICSRCDAFHCKRCVYLNLKTTLEINIPSREQCVTAHIERDIAGELLTSLAGVQAFQRLPRIPALPYRDPIYTLTANNTFYPAEASEGQPIKATSDRMLAQILAMQARILHTLQNN